MSTVIDNFRLCLMRMVLFFKPIVGSIQMQDTKPVSIKERCQAWKPYESIAACFMYRLLDYGYTKSPSITDAEKSVYAKDTANARMGCSRGNIATIEETIKQVDKISEECKLPRSVVDNLIWSFCADGYGEIYTARPNVKIVLLKNFATTPGKTNKLYRNA